MYSTNLCAWHAAEVSELSGDRQVESKSMLKSVDAVRCAMYGGISDFRTLNTSLYQRDTDQIHKLSRRTLNGSEVRKR